VASSSNASQGVGRQRAASSIHKAGKRLASASIAASANSANATEVIPRDVVTDGALKSQRGYESMPVDAKWIQARPNGQPSGAGALLFGKGPASMIRAEEGRACGGPGGTLTISTAAMR
jgi:hypothetical protein